MNKFIMFVSMLLFWATASVSQTVSNEELAVRPVQVKAFLSGKTIRTYNRNGLGNMITYFAPNGTMYIWPPRRAVLTTGTWNACSKDASMVDAKTKKVQKIKLATVCRVIKANGKSSNFDIGWIGFKKMIQEYEVGDVFSLADSSGKTPYAMGKRSVDFAYLRRKIK